MKRINILITHVSYQASAGSFIKLLRKSKMYNFYIVGCDSIEKGYSSGSMLVDKFYYLPFSVSSSEYVPSIMNICADECIDLIISAEEEDLITYKESKIPQSFYESIPDFTIFQLFRDKYKATIDLQKKGFLVPRNIMCLQEFNDSKKEKFIFRKRVACSSRGIRIYHKTEIKDNYQFFSDDHLTQEFVEGDMYTVDVLCNKRGKVHMLIPRRELSCKDGTTFKCIIEKNNLLIDVCKEIYSEYCIPGLSNIQFIIENGKPYFIELNPRAAATMIASSLASVNYLDLYIEHIIFSKSLPDYNVLMKSIKWNSIVSRYYQETILYGGDDNGHES